MVHAYAFNAADILIIGVLLFLAIRFYLKRDADDDGDERGDPPPPPRRLPRDGRSDQDRTTPGARTGRSANAPEEDVSPREASEAYRRAQATWNMLSSKPEARSQDANAAPFRRTNAGAGVPDFDEEDFMRGAKMVYNRIQQSWDARDLEDIRQFVGEQVFRNLKEHAARDPKPSRTQILFIDARLAEVEAQGDDLVASVLYDVTMRKERAKANAKVKEIWTFRKPKADPKAFWKVEGIQQVQ